MPPKAYSLNIGLNNVNPDAYQDYGEVAVLNTPLADAHAMEEIALKLKYSDTKLLLEEQATRDAFFTNVEAIRDRMNPGDLFLLTFSGHGGLREDPTGKEESGYDQTWCFYDGEVVDNEMHNLLKTFEKGHRILVISDSCYSGDILRGGRISDIWGTTERLKDVEGVEASVRLIAGAREDETAKGSKNNGLFTEALLKVWDNGKFNGNYLSFYVSIVSEMSATNGQTPHHQIIGTPDSDFDESKPFEYNSSHSSK